MNRPRLTSTANPKVRRIKGLHQAKARVAEGVALAEGIKVVAELAARPERLLEVFWSETCAARPQGAELLDRLAAAEVSLWEVSEHVLSAMADTRTPQGVVAVVSCQPARLDALLAQGGDVLILDGVHDPGNVGTLIRTAGAAGAAGVVLTGNGADPTAPKVVRSAAGCQFTLPFVVWKEAPEPLAEALNKSGCRIAVARSLGGSAPATVGEGRVAWVLGSEGGGVSTRWEVLADLTVALPMANGVESLNVAVAGSILLFSRVLRA